MEFKGSTDDDVLEDGSIASQAESEWLSYNPDDLIEALRDKDESMRLKQWQLDLVYRAFVSGYLTAFDNLISGNKLTEGSN